ncbi:MAG: hypothetical protein JXR19_08855 [Bacteroidia bacterium]
MTKQTNIFKKWEDRLLKSNPTMWILGVHYFVPIILIVGAILFAIGFAYQYDLQHTPYYELGSFFGVLTLLMSLLSILLLIMFIIRQVRFNTHRIHHRLPYKKGFFFFVSFFIVIASISTLPVMGNLGSYVKSYYQTAEVRAALYEAEANDYYNNWDGSVTDEQFAEMVQNKSKMFYPAKWDFWNVYLVFSLFIAMMLFAICSTTPRDFGWSMLISALIPICYGILFAVLEIAGGIGSERTIGVGLMTFFVLLTAFIGLIRPNGSSAKSNAFAISLYIGSPMVVFLYAVWWDLDSLTDHSGLFFITAIVMTILFNYIFKRRYIEPA